MKLSPKAENILAEVSGKNIKLGDLRKIANEIKKDHSLAMELWVTEHFFARQLAILIMDKKQLYQDVEFVNREGQFRNPLCIAAFRITHPDWSDEEADRANNRAVEMINASGHSYVSGTSWQARSAIRAAFVNWQTRVEHVQQLFADVEDAGRQLI